jgi:hypothetical protein
MSTVIMKHLVKNFTNTHIYSLYAYLFHSLNKTEAELKEIVYQKKNVLLQKLNLCQMIIKCINYNCKIFDKIFADAHKCSPLHTLPSVIKL